MTTETPTACRYCGQMPTIEDTDKFYAVACTNPDCTHKPRAHWFLGAFIYPGMAPNTAIGDWNYQHGTVGPVQIQALKENWRGDPCWDIEDTEGFEPFRDELKAWRLEYERAEQERTRREEAERAGSMGLEPDSPLYLYLRELEQKVERMSSQLAEIEANH
jgi:hypothetical protein